MSDWVAPGLPELVFLAVFVGLAVILRLLYEGLKALLQWGLRR